MIVVTLLINRRVGLHEFNKSKRVLEWLSP